MGSIDGVGRRRAVLLVLSCVLSVALSGAVAHAASPLTVVQRVGTSTERITTSSTGYALWILDRRGKPRDGIEIDYAKRTVTLVDGGKRRYQRLGLEKAERLAASERRALNSKPKPYVGRVPLAGGEVLKPLGLRRRLNGVLAGAWIDHLPGGGVRRVWYALGAPRPPAAVRRQLARLAPRGGKSLQSDVPLLVENLLGGRWRSVAKARSVRRAIPEGTFGVPRGLRRANLLKSAVAQPARVPGHMFRVNSLLPLATHPNAFLIFRGDMFGGHPERFTTPLTDALRRVIFAQPYISGLSFYGIGAGPIGDFVPDFGRGRVVGTTVSNRNPARSIGMPGPDGLGAALPIVEEARLLPGAPGLWTRFDQQQPLFIIFVPRDRVNLPAPVNGSTTIGYHFGAPTLALFGDPLGIFIEPAIPYAIVTVPRPSSATDRSWRDDATELTSHEVVESETNPLANGWLDPSQEGGVTHGEIGDTCSEGVTLPWGAHTRVSGVAVSTYWAQGAGACLPESRPTIRITSPTRAITVNRGDQVSLSAVASDPLDGPLRNITWTSNIGEGTLPQGTNVLIRFLHPGLHKLQATAIDSQNLRADATVNVNVASALPHATIYAPPNPTSVTSDQLVVFHGDGDDRFEGRIPPSDLRWHADDGAAGTGRHFAHQFAVGDHVVSLQSVNDIGQFSQPVFVHLHVVAPPKRGPLPGVEIDTPDWGDNFPTENPTIYVHAFTTNSPTNIEWYDDWTDSRGVAHHDHLPGGVTSQYVTLTSGGTLVSHRITVVVSDAHGNQSQDAVTVSAGSFS
jgi:hypothetical protein